MSVKIIFVPNKPNDRLGYLKVRILENQKKKVKSLGIKIARKNWLDDKQEVGKGEKNYEKINEKIAEVLNELYEHNNNLRVLELRREKSSSILDFLQKKHDSTLKKSTRQNFSGLKSVLIKYLETKSREDILFCELDYDTVIDFYNYLMRNGYNPNTAKDYVNRLKYVTNDAISQKLVSFTEYPFLNVKLKGVAKKLKTFSEEDISKIIDKDFSEYWFKYKKTQHSLEEVKKAYLFQFAMQGIRVSDLFLMRWSNFKYEDKILSLDFQMYKTKKQISIQVSPFAIKLLDSVLLCKFPKLDEEIDLIQFRRNDHLEEILKAKGLIKKHEKREEVVSLERLMSIVKNEEKEKAAEQFTSESWVFTQKELIKMREKMIFELDEQVYEVRAKKIIQLSSGSASNEFVFYFLDNTLFEGSKKRNFDLLTDDEADALDYGRGMYNKQLNRIGEICELPVKLSSHTARHSYTQMILEYNASLMDVSISLGHANLKTTENYIQKLKSQNVQNLSSAISNKFDK